MNEQESLENLRKMIKKTEDFLTLCLEAQQKLECKIISTQEALKYIKEIERRQLN